MMVSHDFNKLQHVLCYRFQEMELLREALRHSSYVNEKNEPALRDNERLEFLGDAVLNLVIGDLLMQAYPRLREGELSRIRANMVNETQLADIARSIEMGTYLHLGKGEIQTGGFEKNSLLANAFEALMAAIYLDRGYQAAFEIIERLFRELIDAAPDFIGGQDFKSRLQEAVQSIYKEVPRYTVVEETGPDHDKTFRVEAEVGELTAEGSGKSKKTAEQDAARRALKLIGI